MKPNKELKLHFVNVNHGDCTIVEFPDYGDTTAAHFGVIDFGAKKGVDRDLPRDYMKALIELRRNGDASLNYTIEFVCVSHPHDDHWGGLGRFLDEFSDAVNQKNNKVKRYWDCGFWTTNTDYNNALVKIRDNDAITFTRVSSGSEYEFGDTKIAILAPSIDLRNRFDTYGVERNDSSIVLRIKYKRSYAIIAGDAQFASWGKTTEEYPRQHGIDYHEDALGYTERKDTADQLSCNVFRASHHGSKHGTSLECMERIKPKHVIFSAGSQEWYRRYVPNWVGDFPHPLTTLIFQSLRKPVTNHVTGDKGNIIFKYKGSSSPREISYVDKRPDERDFVSALRAKWD